MPDVTTDAGWAGGRRWSSLAGNRLTLILAIYVAVGVIYWPSAAALDGIWRGSAGDTYTHGYLVLIASLCLIVRDRGRFAAAPVRRPGSWAWALLVALSAAWLWSWRAALQECHVLLLPIILLATVLALLGWRVARVLLFPVGLLVFAMPLWAVINDGLLTLSARTNGTLIWLTGIPAYMQGHLIRLPGGTMEIAQACTGLNGFVIGLCLAALYGEILRDPLRLRLAWLALMGALALIANAVRIFIVTVAASETAMRTPLVRHHIWLGWCLFALAVAAFLAITARFGDSRAGGRGAEADAPKGTLEGRTVTGARPLDSEYPSGVRLAMALACLGLLPALAYGMDALRSGTKTEIRILWPEMPGKWQGPAPDTVSDWSPRFVNPSATSLQRYVDASAQPVEVFAVVYRTQRQGAKLLGYQNDLLGGAKLRSAGSGRIVDSSIGRWREALAEDAVGARSLVWWRYRIGDRLFVEPRLSQAWYGLADLTGDPLSSLIALRAICSPDCAAARSRLASAASQLPPVLVLRPAALP